MRFGIIFGVGLFASLAGFFLFQAFTVASLEYPKNLLVLLCLPTVLFMLRLTYFGARLIPFLNSKFSASKDGLRIRFSGGRSIYYEWDVIGSVRDRDLLQIFEVRSHSGTVLLSIDYLTPGLNQMKDFILDSIPTKIKEDKLPILWSWLFRLFPKDNDSPEKTNTHTNKSE